MAGLFCFYNKYFNPVLSMAAVVSNIFFIIAMCAMIFVAYYYILWPVALQNKIYKRQQQRYRDWIIRRDTERWVKNMKLLRGYSFVTAFISLFWSWATWYAKEDVWGILLFGCSSILTGFSRYNTLPKYIGYVFILPMILMFLGSWCHFEPLLPIGIALFFVNIITVIIFHYGVTKYQ